MKKLFALFFIFCNFFAFCQAPVTKAAISAFESQMFYEAIPLLQRAWAVEKSDKIRPKIVFMLAECYKENAEFTQALEQYKRAEWLGVGTEASIGKITMLKAIGRYSEAREALMEIMPENKSGDNEQYIELKQILDGINFAEKLSSLKARYIVKNVNQINSSQRDFAPTFAGKNRSPHELVITSTRRASSAAEMDTRTGEQASALFITKAEAKSINQKDAVLSWSMPRLLVGYINSPNHQGAATVSKNGDKIYFTSCRSQNFENMGCAILCSSFAENKWQMAEVIVQLDSGYAVGHPSLSYDEKKIYFASDLSSKGKKDIFYIEKKANNSWSAPVRLSNVINTPGNEVFPFVDENGNLYFASDGHPGMGGLDIFVSYLKNGIFQPPINLAPPINSPADDFGLIAYQNGEKGYFSSNRPSGVGKDDIYEFSIIPYLYSLKGKILESTSLSPISEVEIRLEGSDGSLAAIWSDKKGEFFFSEDLIRGSVSYKITMDSPSYLTRSTTFSTFGFSESEFKDTPKGMIAESFVNLELDPLTKTIILPRIEYDFNSAKLRDESKVSLMSLVEILNENPDIIIELRSHTDHIGSDDYNLNLSQARAESCVNFLISSGINPKRLRAKGMGETEPFVISPNFKSIFPVGTILTESFVTSLGDNNAEEQARQLNRRTDFKVLGMLVEEDENPNLTQDIQNDDQVFEEKKVKIIEISESAELPKTTKFEREAFYVLSAEDNYGTVAKKFELQTEELRALNGGLKGVSPFEGMKLKVSKNADYSDFDAKFYRLERVDNSLEVIITKLSLDKETFLNMNSQFNPEQIKPGDIVRRAQEGQTNN